MQTPDNLKLINLIKESGEVGRIIFETDWSNNPLGTLSQWPTSLLQHLCNILNRRIPAFIYWGEDQICFYNDSFIPSLGNTGKHPSMLGTKASIAWGEIYEKISKDIHDVYNYGHNTWYENRKLAIFRDGKIDDAFWTYGHSPIYGIDGSIEGVIISLVETTPQLSQIEQLYESNEKIGNLIKQAPFAMCYLNGKELAFEIVNDLYLALIKKSREEVVNKKLYHVLPEVEEHLSGIFENVRIKGIQFDAKEYPVEIFKDGRLSLGYYDFVYHPVYNEKQKFYDILVMAFEVTETKKNRELVLESKKRYETLANSMPQIVWIADAEGDVYYWNDATFDFTGLTYEELRTGNKWVQVIHPDEAANNYDVWMKSVNTGQPYLIEHRFKNAKNEYKWMLSRALPLYDEEGTITMWVGTSTDIDDKKNLEIHKDEFIKMANHELKTPITTLKGYTQLINNNLLENSDATLVHSIKAIDSQVNKLEKLIEDMLDLSRIETGTLPFRTADTNILDVIDECINDISVVYKKVNIKKCYDYNSELIVNVDADRMRQVFYNLLTNAIKYAPNSESIDIIVEPSQEKVDISIRDYGIGIKKEYLKKLFERFFRVPGDSAKKFSGFGIGLFLVKEIVERHNGSINVESEVGVGSTFKITLPLSLN